MKEYYLENLLLYNNINIPIKKSNVDKCVNIKII